MEEQILPNTNGLILSKLSNKSQYSENISAEVWNFRIDSNQISQNWFKARNGSFLNSEDAQKYQRIMTLLKEMVKLMENIQIAIEHEHLKKLEVFQKIRVIVAQKLEIEPDQVKQESNFTKDLGVDSLDMLELIMVMEQAFNIEIPEQIAETFVTIKQVIDYINQKVDFAI